MPVAAFIFLALVALAPLPETPLLKVHAAREDTSVREFARTLFRWKAQRDARLEPKILEAFLALSQGSNRPSGENVRLFLDHLLRALSGSRVSEEHAMQLAHDFHEVLHAAYLTDEGLEKVLKDVGKQLAAAGVAQFEVDRLVARLRNMGAEVRDAGRILDPRMD